MASRKLGSVNKGGHDRYCIMVIVERTHWRVGV